MNKIFSRALLISASSLLLMSCSSGWDENPFEGYSEEIKTARLEEDKVVSINSEAILLDVKSSYTFHEGRESVFQLSYRFFEKDLELVDFFIEDQELLLPGSKFDPVSGELIWTPSEDYIVGDAYSKQEELALILLVRQGNRLFEIKDSLHINVYQKLMTPELKITKPFSSGVNLEEGNTYTLEVEVTDPDSIGLTLGLDKAPKVSLSFGGGVALEAANWIKQAGRPEQNDQDRKVWKFSYSLDLRNQGIEALKSYTLSLSTASRFGLSSNIETVDFRTVPFLEKPATSWRRGTFFSLGERSNFSFRVFNPDGFDVDRITVDFGSTCRDQGLTCHCVRSSGGVDASCTVSGVLQSNKEISIAYTVVMSAFNKHTRGSFKGVIVPARQGN